MNEQIPNWVSWLSGLSVPVLAVFGSLIAWRQSVVSKETLRLELFEKRMEVYRLVQKFEDEIYNSKDLGRDSIKTLNRAIDNCQFLFGTEVLGCLIQIRNIAADYLNSISITDAIIYNFGPVENQISFTPIDKILSGENTRPTSFRENEFSTEDSDKFRLLLDEKFEEFPIVLKRYMAFAQSS
jgi:hypothetical protein